MFWLVFGLFFSVGSRVITYNFSLQKKVVVEKDGVKKDIYFRKILFNRLQKEFEKENSLGKTINEKVADLVNQGLNVSTATEFITFVSWSLCILF